MDNALIITFSLKGLITVSITAMVILIIVMVEKIIKLFLK